MIMEMTYDKINDGIAFRESDHVYFNVNNPDIKYISVTTLIEKFGKPFDKEFWSQYKALEKVLDPDYFKLEKKRLLDTKKFNKDYYLKTYNIDEVKFNSAQQDILDAWQQENQKSCERGTAIHAGFEHEFLDAGVCELKKYGLGGKFNVKSGDTPLDEEKGVYPEYLYQAERYRTNKYATDIRTALEHRDEIREVLNQYRTEPLPDSWWPISVFSSFTDRDNTTVLGWDGEWGVTYHVRDINSI